MSDYNLSSYIKSLLSHFTCSLLARFRTFCFALLSNTKEELITVAREGRVDGKTSWADQVKMGNGNDVHRHGMRQTHASNTIQEVTKNVPLYPTHSPSSVGT